MIHNIFLAAITSIVGGFFVTIPIMLFDFIEGCIYSAVRNKGKPKSEWKYYAKDGLGRSIRISHESYSSIKDMIKAIFKTDSLMWIFMSGLFMIFLVPIMVMGL